MTREDSHRRGGAWRFAAVMAAAACLAAALFAASSLARFASPSPSAAGGPDPYRAGEAIVGYEPGTTAAERLDARRAADVEAKGSLGLPRTQLVAVEGSVADAVERLRRQPGVAYAQPNYRYEAAAVEPPKDSFFKELWGLEDPALPNPGVSVLEAWEQSKGAGQVIAVLDTGVDLTHPDLAPHLWENPGPDPGPHGYDFIDDDGDPDDFQFHGTHVAGTAAAVAGNELGIAGVAPEAEIMAVRVLNGNGFGLTDGIADGIAYAANHGADVINLSLSGPGGGDPALSSAVDLAASKGVVVVAAAGNDGANNDLQPTAPCTLPQANLICVAALSQGGGLASFSNFGASSVDLAAPGTSILSAKADYGAPLFDNGFEAGETGAWGTVVGNGGVKWGLSSPGASSSAQAATDSPAGKYGNPVDPSKRAISAMLTVEPIDLTGERGCRVHFRTKYEIERFADEFAAGAVDEGSSAALRAFDGVSPAYASGKFEAKEVSISDLDGAGDVHPIFRIASDDSVQLDGAYVDDVRLICRDESYLDAIAKLSQYDQADAGSYVSLQGTSMATPHVAGIAALVRAAAPGATATEVVDAILAGTSALPGDSATKPTVTHGIADACQAIAVASGADFAVECPGSSENVIPQPPPAAPQVGETLAQPVADTTRPRTFFAKRPPRVVRIRGTEVAITIRFRSNEAGVTFVCKVDSAPQRFCPPRLKRRFGLGRHVVRVRARDAAGNIDRTPAVLRFRVVRRG